MPLPRYANPNSTVPAVATGSAASAPTAKKATSPKPSKSTSKTRKATAKKTGPKKVAAKEATAKRATAKKTTAKRATAKKTTAKKATAKRATAKKTTAKKATAKKATTKKAGDNGSGARPLIRPIAWTVQDLPEYQQFYLCSGQRLRNIKELAEVRPHVKVVGTSATDHQHEFKKLGVDRYLDKGWQIADLIQVVSI